jgi:hypothetical protein
VTGAPWTFDEARLKCLEASRRQEAAEDVLRQSYRDSAQSEEAYRVALADKIIDLRNDGVAATACADIARGDRKVAALRVKRDIAEGVREAMSQAAWRLTADRKDAQRFSDWSQRREMAETGHQPLEGSIA